MAFITGTESRILQECRAILRTREHHFFREEAMLVVRAWDRYLRELPESEEDVISVAQLRTILTYHSLLLNAMAFFREQGGESAVV